MTLFLAKNFAFEAAVQMGLPREDWRMVPEDTLQEAYIEGPRRQFNLGWSLLLEMSASVKRSGEAVTLPLYEPELQDDLLRLVGAAHCNAVLRELLGVSLALPRPGYLWIGPAGTEPVRTFIRPAELEHRYADGWAFMKGRARAVHAVGTPQRFDVHPDDEAPLVEQLVGLMAYSDHRVVIEEQFEVIILWAHCCGVHIGTRQAPPRIDLIEQMGLQIDQGMAC